MTGSRPTEPQAELGDGSSVVSCVCPRNAAKPASEAEESAAHHRMVVEPEDLVDEGQRRYGSFPTNVARNLAPILSGQPPARVPPRGHWATTSATPRRHRSGRTPGRSVPGVARR